MTLTDAERIAYEILPAVDLDYLIRRVGGESENYVVDAYLPGRDDVWECVDSPRFTVSDARDLRTRLKSVPASDRMKLRRPAGAARRVAA